MRWIAAVVTLALLGSSCSTSSNDDGASTLFEDVTVEFLSVASDEVGSIQVESVDPPEVSGLDGSAVLAGFDFSVESQPTQPVEIAFQVDGFDQDRHGPLVLLWGDTLESVAFVPSEIDGDGHLTATVPHFSFGVVASLGDLGSMVSRFLRGRSDVADPQCSGSLNTDRVRFSENAGDTIKWCAEPAGEGIRLRVANNRRSYTELVFPETWTVEDQSGPSISNEVLVRLVGDGLAELSYPGRNSIQISGGDTISIFVPEGASGELRAQMSGTTWFWSALIFGVQQYIGAARTGGVDPVGRFGEALLSLFYSGPVDFTSNGALALRDCWSGFRNSFGDSLTEPLEEPDLAFKVFEYALDCLPGVFEASLDGLSLWTRTLAASFLAVLAILVGGFELLSSAFRAIWDSVASLFGDSTPYRSVQVDYDGGESAQDCSLEGSLPMAVETTACEILKTARAGDVAALERLMEQSEVEYFESNCCDSPAQNQSRWEHTRDSHFETDSGLAARILDTLATRPESADSGRGVRYYWTSTSCEPWLLIIDGSGDWSGLLGVELDERGGCSDEHDSTLPPLESDLCASCREVARVDMNDDGRDDTVVLDVELGDTATGDRIRLTVIDGASGASAFATSDQPVNAGVVELLDVVPTSRDGSIVVVLADRFPNLDFVEAFTYTDGRLVRSEGASSLFSIGTDLRFSQDWGCATWGGEPVLVFRTVERVTAPLFEVETSFYDLTGGQVELLESSREQLAVQGGDDSSAAWDLDLVPLPACELDD